jgi:hypothetical protein
MILTAYWLGTRLDPRMETARHLADRVCGGSRVSLQWCAADAGFGGRQIDGMSALQRTPDRRVEDHCAPGAGWWLDDRAGAEGQWATSPGEAVGPPCACTRVLRRERYASPADIGPVAKAHRPALRRVSLGFEARRRGSYDGRSWRRPPIASLRAGCGPRRQRRRARLTWWNLMRDPAGARRARKLLVAVGPDNVLWGTDSLWYGSPQDQIQAFRVRDLDRAPGTLRLSGADRSSNGILGANARLVRHRCARQEVRVQPGRAGEQRETDDVRAAPSVRRRIVSCRRSWRPRGDLAV